MTACSRDEAAGRAQARQQARAREAAAMLLVPATREMLISIYLYLGRYIYISIYVSIYAAGPGHTGDAEPRAQQPGTANYMYLSNFYIRSL